MGSLYGSLFGFGDDESDEERRERILRENRRKGKAAEELIEQRYGLEGYEVERTGRGHDYLVTKRDPFTGRIIDRAYIEVKYGDSPLSDLQWESSQEHRGHYRVERLILPPFFWQDI